MTTLFRAKVFNEKYIIVYPLFNVSKYFLAWMMSKEYFNEVNEKVIYNLCDYARMLSEYPALRREFLGPIECVAEVSIMSSCILADMSPAEFMNAIKNLFLIRVNGERGSLELSSRNENSDEVAKDFYAAFDSTTDFFSYVKTIDED